ncbi:MAG: SPFH domain-containing protein, partial [Betaproteobacteria bacterium]
MEPHYFLSAVPTHGGPESADREHSRQEIEARVVNGWMALLIVSALLIFGCCFVVGSLPRFETRPLVAGLLLLGVGVFCLRGFFTCEPNNAVVMIFLGSYAGTARSSGFHWANPLYLRLRVSLRAQTLMTAIVKVNDERGHPIEIAAVLTWKLSDTARAVFEVEDCAQYIR